ncbi:MAG: Gfo/Idh/MocA family oxidoreductase [Thermodesulfobacteriota bacterium]|nr:Gfo/Idh/MocA family oxidoreductase [Thermodesulfobacteriota bacterium]
MVNVAVVGSGYWGKNLIRNFNELGALRVICDKDIRTLRSFQDRYPDKEFYTSFEAVIQNPTVDAVAIATPAETHYELAKRAILAEKDVFVEKPLALKVDEAEDLHDLAVNRDRRLMVGHVLLYHPAIIRLKEIIDSGELGKINYIYSNRLNLGKFRSEENILWSFAPHDISVIMYLLEEMPAHIVAQGGNYLNRDIADVTISVLSFRSGVKGHIFVSWLHPNKEQKLVVVGDKKMAVFDDTLNEGKLRIHNKGVEWVNRRPVPRKNKAKSIPIDPYEPLKAECIHFLKCVESGITPRTDGMNGIQVLKILNACQNSLENNGSVIEMTDNSHWGSFFAHETAVVDTPCRIGEETRIWHFSHIMSGSEIGEGCNIGQNVVISQGVRIGNNVKIQNNVSVCEGVVFEDDVFCGPSMVFTNVVDPRSYVPKRQGLRHTLVQKGSTIGPNSTIVCGCTIGKYSYVGAGAVVISDVPDFSHVIGNPAEVIGWICECGQQLQFQNEHAVCDNCRRQYRVNDDRVERIHDDLIVKQVVMGA